MTTPTARERISANYSPDGCCELCEECHEDIARMFEAAERAAAEAMRKRCARLVDNDGFYKTASAIRALPLEVDDGE